MKGKARQLSCVCVALVTGVMAGQARAEEGQIEGGHAAEGYTYGIGAGVDGNGGSIYFPIKTTSGLIEPRISYSRYEDKGGGGGTYTRTYVDPNITEYSTVRETRRLAERSSIELGLGFFGTKRLEEVFEIYYGARVGYVKRDQKYKYTSTYTDADGVSTDTNVDSTDQSGYFIAPAFGVQYFLYRRASIGFEVALRYEKLTGDDDENNSDMSDSYTGNSSSSGDTESEAFNTQTHVVIRAYF